MPFIVPCLYSGKCPFCHFPFQSSLSATALGACPNAVVLQTNAFLVATAIRDQWSLKPCDVRAKQRDAFCFFSVGCPVVDQ